jgi:hypothetical protein
MDDLRVELEQIRQRVKALEDKSMLWAKVNMLTVSGPPQELLFHCLADIYDKWLALGHDREHALKVFRRFMVAVADDCYRHPTEDVLKGLEKD